MKPIIFGILCAYAAACGRDPRRCDEHAQPAPRAAAQVHVWEGSEQLRQAKQTVVDTCRGKVSDERTALILAVLQGETNDGQASQRDTSKDNSGLAKNFSAFNVNKDWLQTVGWDEARSPDLNDQVHLSVATEWIIKGIEKQGEDGFLNFHRGGSSGAADGISYGCVEYRQAMRAIQAKILADRSLMTSCHRIAAEIPHV